MSFISPAGGVPKSNLPGLNVALLLHYGSSKADTSYSPAQGHSSSQRAVSRRCIPAVRSPGGDRAIDPHPLEHPGLECRWSDSVFQGDSNRILRLRRGRNRTRGRRAEATWAESTPRNAHTSREEGNLHQEGEIKTVFRAEPQISDRRSEPRIVDRSLRFRGQSQSIFSFLLKNTLFRGPFLIG